MSTAPAAPTAANLRAIKARQRRNNLFGWAFAAPFALFFAATFIVPILVSVHQSFFQTKVSGGGLYGGGETVTSFVGLDNFAAVVTNGAFWTGIGRVVVYAAFQIPVMILTALVLALLLDSYLVKRVTIFRLGYFLPYAIPGVVAAMVWLYLYSPQLSPLSDWLGISFFSKNVILASMANMTTWTFTGYNMLVFLAALQAIPQELYEAARLDGASGFQIATRIKVPMVSGAALLTVLLSIIGTIQLFNEPTVMSTGQSWMGNNYTPMMMAYNTMMVSPGDPHTASAISIVMALIAGALAAVYALVQRRIQK
ncbi:MULTISPECIES: sugar ABC transporter permease [unclassified Actinomyces]|uniref:carbohydrate ABC transporter permease n=1 Tax=unclassified Actinomyces TaxID=2609248 RepID=UPI002016F52A|nr:MULTISPECIES: sugar ABC transporter permease [unclassified Actinomyces]MCL3777781.1 sugar ABC transporter permease [Actinomyces sp. AC-20-1]MCL3789457.1 sugar ABC transporter permease [Actinomyces sp. 187325]MCL3791760.1 sugar ABC transporter permease [Actinomyces sp. 186855]MCL3794850.1 sugar ABC transporter permease [Actinomyces sp. 217892]